MAYESDDSKRECQGKHMSLYVSSDKERAAVAIIPGELTELSTGSHVIHRDGCAINVHVINNGMYNIINALTMIISFLPTHTYFSDKEWKPR